jgi:hypothetical protein
LNVERAARLGDELLFPTNSMEVRKSSSRHGEGGREKSSRPFALTWRTRRRRRENMSENLNPSLMTAEQKTTVLIRFSETLDVFAHQLPSDKQGLATLVTSAATSIRELAREVGKGDVDVAAEITSTARLVGAVRKVVNASISKSTIH